MGMGLRSYIVTRIILMIPMILFLISIVFVIVRVLPGDPVLLHFEKRATEAELAAMRQALGLDVPIWQQYLNYVLGFFRGDLGRSMAGELPPVAPLIFSAFPATLELAIYAIIIAVLIGVFLGSRSAESYNKPIDHLFRLSGIVSYAIPVFFLGMILQLIFCVWLGWFPIGGRFYPGGQPQGLNVSLSMPQVGFALGFILPSLVTILPFAVSFLMVRRWHTEPKPLDLLFVFASFLASSILYGILILRIPGALAATMVALIPFALVLMLLMQRRGKFQTTDLQILLPVLLVSLLLYGLAASLMPLLLLSYFIGLLPAIMFLRSIKKRKTKLLAKDLRAPLVLLLVLWLLFVFGAWSSILAGGLQIKTGLYTVDSVLEGSPYDFVQSFRYLLLPALTLGIVLSGVFLRLTRTNMIETLRFDYVTAAKARGLKRRTVTYGYAFRNAFLPVLTMIGLQFAALLAGAVLTETTFSWPGLGKFLVDRINSRDYTSIQSSVVLFGVFVMVVSLIVDLLYAYLDPRVRL